MSMIDISEVSQQLANELAVKTGLSVSEVLDHALKSYQREVFFGKLNAGYAKLQSDPAAWSQHEAERKEWDNTLMDGLDENENWTEGGECLPTNRDEG